MTSRAAVFDLIKTDGPITANKISYRLTIGEKTARNHIDALRASGEAIWYDPQTAGFWWRDDLRPGLEAHQRWKRPFDCSPTRHITAGSPPSQNRERSLGPTSGARLAISESTWSRLVDANERLVRAGLAQPGVFATAVGPQYQAGSSRSLLYVGKSPGPKANLVGSVHDQAASCRASTEWMMRFKNQSPFWQFIDQVRLTRAEIAWTNVCKMGRTTGGPPPAGRVWQTIAAPCLAALGEELEWLQPRLAVFATSDTYSGDLEQLISSQGYRCTQVPFKDDWTRLSMSADGRAIIRTRHPQGWNGPDRDRVIDLINSLLGT